MDKGVLGYLNPGEYPPGNKAYIWVYLALLVVVILLYSGLKRGWDYVWTYNRRRIEQHSQQMREIREAQLQRWETEVANRPPVAPTPPPPQIDPSLERRSAYMHPDQDSRPYRPNVRDRYKRVTGKKGG